MWVRTFNCKRTRSDLFSCFNNLNHSETSKPGSWALGPAESWRVLQSPGGSWRVLEGPGSLGYGQVCMMTVWRVWFWRLQVSGEVKESKEASLSSDPGRSWYVMSASLTAASVGKQKFTGSETAGQSGVITQ